MRVVFYGAGSSAAGVSSMIVSLLRTAAGMSLEEAQKVRHAMLPQPLRHLFRVFRGFRVEDFGFCRTWV